MISENRPKAHPMTKLCALMGIFLVGAFVMFCMMSALHPGARWLVKFGGAILGGLMPLAYVLAPLLAVDALRALRRRNRHSGPDGTEEEQSPEPTEEGEPTE